MPTFNTRNSLMPCLRWRADAEHKPTRSQVAHVIDELCEDVKAANLNLLLQMRRMAGHGREISRRAAELRNKAMQRCLLKRLPRARQRLPVQLQMGWHRPGVRVETLESQSRPRSECAVSAYPTHSNLKYAVAPRIGFCLKGVDGAVAVACSGKQTQLETR